MDSVIKLIAQTSTQNAFGVWETTTSEREVFCKVDSVDRTEFFEGGRNGLNPEFRFTIFAGEYQGESICEYSNNRYAIYRTYHVPATDYMEIYAQREGGTNT